MPMQLDIFVDKKGRLSQHYVCSELCCVTHGAHKFSMRPIGDDATQMQQ